MTDADDVRGLLADHPVLGRLDPAAREAWIHRSLLQVLEANAALGATGYLADHLVLVLRGGLELQIGAEGEPVSFTRAEWMGAGVTPLDLQSEARLRAVGPTAVLVTPASVLRSFLETHRILELFFPVALPVDETAVPFGEGVVSVTDDAMLSTSLGAMTERAPVTLSSSQSILEAATAMQREGVSSILLLDDGKLVGLVTDRDLRNRVLAAGLSPLRPIAEVATRDPITLPAQATAFEALMTMTRHNLHHLPVVEAGRVRGLVTANDLVRQQSASAVYLVGDIRRQGAVEGLARAAQRVGALQAQLAAANASASVTGHVVTAVADALTTRLIELAEQQLGPAPVPYVWVAAGSQARSEQTARSDQDNCLILDDTFDPERHGDYFRAFARFVCDGLDACGYVHCPGEMMAMTDRWRQPKSRWAAYFEGWIRQPDPMALMLTSVFFDLRAVHGRYALLDALRDEVLTATRGNSLFLAHMVGNALKHRPPLGLFGQLAVPRTGTQAGRIDLKHSGVVPIVDLARVYALAGGLRGVNTRDRLLEAGSAGEISEQGARDLREAHEFLGRLRIRHQVRQRALGQPPDNLLDPATLSSFERRQLRDAFSVVANLQSVLGQRYQAGRF